MQSEPYCYIGRIAYPSDLNGIVGTATLIGPKHILTAAHVIQEGGNDLTFVLPDGRSSPIVAAELDGGMRAREVTRGLLHFSSFDLAVCTLRDELGSNGRHAAWGVFDDK